MEMLHTKIWYLWEVGFSFIKWEKGGFEKGGMKYRPSADCSDFQSWNHRSTNTLHRHLDKSDTFISDSLKFTFSLFKMTFSNFLE